MHKLKKLLGKILIGTMLLTFTGATNLVINAADTTNPYIKLYLDNKASVNSTASVNQQKVEPIVDPQIEEQIIIATLEDYYKSDKEVANVLKKYINYSDLNEDTLSIKKEDKISIMRKIKQVYSQVKSNDDQKILKDYLGRYVINSGDDDLISFFNKLNPPAKSIRTDLNIQDKEKYGEVSTTGINATAVYKGTYTGGLAGDWAYNNYNKYSTSFPAFHNNNNYGSDCTNFVSQAMYFGGGMPFQENWYCFMKNPTYLNPTSANELNFSWTLSDPSPWISVKEFRDFWMYKAVGTYYCTKSDYVANHVTQYTKPIRKGDVIVLHKGIADFITVPTHCMIISRYDTVNKDFLLAGHSNERQSHPLLTAIDSYACVEFITF